MAKRPEIWHSPPYTKADIRAIQTLERYARGAVQPWPPGDEPPVPTPHDVKRALDWIIFYACQDHENGTMASLAAGNDPHGRVAALIDGRRSVAKEIKKLMELKPEMFPSE